MESLFHNLCYVLSNSLVFPNRTSSEENKKEKERHHKY